MDIVLVYSLMKPWVKSSKVKSLGYILSFKSAIMPALRRLLLLPLIALSSSPLATASPLSSRSTKYYGLIFAQDSGCTPDQTTAVLNAITDMRSLCTSATSALKSSNTLSSYFFESSYFTPASAVFNAALFETQPLESLPTDPSHGTQIQLYCANATDATCATPSPGDNSVADKGSTTTTWGYIGANPVFGQGGAAEIYACPSLLDGTLPRNTPSCTGTPGIATMGWAFLRTFIQLKTLQTVPKLATGKTISDRAPGVAQSHALLKSGTLDYTLNADNFAELAIWAWDVGASGDAGQPFQCPQDIPFS